MLILNVMNSITSCHNSKHFHIRQSFCRVIKKNYAKLVWNRFILSKPITLKKFAWTLDLFLQDTNQVFKHGPNFFCNFIYLFLNSIFKTTFHKCKENCLGRFFVLFLSTQIIANYVGIKSPRCTVLFKVWIV